MIKNPIEGKKYWIIATSRSQFEQAKLVLGYTRQIQADFGVPDNIIRNIFSKKNKPRLITLGEKHDFDCHWDKKTSTTVPDEPTYEARLYNRTKYCVAHFGGLTKYDLFSTYEAALANYMKWLVKEINSYRRNAQKYQDQLIKLV